MATLAMLSGRCDHRRDDGVGKRRVAPSHRSVSRETRDGDDPPWRKPEDPPVLGAGRGERGRKHETAKDIGGEDPGADRRYGKRPLLNRASQQPPWNGSTNVSRRKVDTDALRAGAGIRGGAWAGRDVPQEVRPVDKQTSRPWERDEGRTHRRAVVDPSLGSAGRSRSADILLHGKGKVHTAAEGGRRGGYQDADNLAYGGGCVPERNCYSLSTANPHEDSTTPVLTRQKHPVPTADRPTPRQSSRSHDARPATRDEPGPTGIRTGGSTLRARSHTQIFSRGYATHTAGGVRPPQPRDAAPWEKQEKRAGSVGFTVNSHLSHASTTAPWMKQSPRAQRTGVNTSARAAMNAQKAWVPEGASQRSARSATHASPASGVQPRSSSVQHF